jgi:hypothetical protein
LLITSYFVCFTFIYFCCSILATCWNKVYSYSAPVYFLLVTGDPRFFFTTLSVLFLKRNHRVSGSGEITQRKRRNNSCAPPYPVLYIRRNNTCEHPCPEKIMHTSLHIWRYIAHAVFRVVLTSLIDDSVIVCAALWVEKLFLFKHNAKVFKNCWYKYAYSE